MARLPSREPLRRIDDILNAIDKIEEYVAAAGGIDRLMQVEDAFHDGVERRLSIISEAAVKLGDTAHALAPSVTWSDIRGLGNALRHNYDSVSDGVIRLILTTHLGPLKDACLRAKAKLTDQ
jgi:uncharacterized protein with HEPN domain